MSVTIRGFNIEVGVNTKKMKEQFKEIDSTISQSMRITRAYQKSLKSDWSMDTFLDAQSAAKKALSETEDEIKLVKKAIEDAEKLDTDEARKNVDMLKVKLIGIEETAKKASKSLLEIAGSEFKDTLSKADKEIDLTKRKLETLTTGLSMKWDNNTFKQAQAAARDEVDKTHNKVKVLEKELARLDADSSTDKTSLEYQDLCVQLDETKMKVSQTEKQLQGINQIKFDKVAGLLNDIGNTMLRSGAVLTAGVTVPLAMAGKKALDTASALTEVQNVVDVSFKESSDSINSWSKSLLDSNGISELTAKQNAGLFKSMANSMGVVDDAGTEMARSLTERISDVASFRDISFEKAGTALKAVFTGETESIKEIGVVMTEANVNAYALAHGMEKISDDMSQAEKVALRYKYVMDSTNEMQGDFARTIDSTANQTKLARERFKSLSIELATELLPIATDILKWANETMKAFSGMSEETKKTTLVIIGLAAGLGPAVTALGGMVKGTALVTKGVAAFKAANDAATVSQAALNAVTALSPAGLAMIATALAAVTIGAVSYAAANTEAVKKQREINEEISKLESDNISEASSRMAELKVASEITIPRIEALGSKLNRTAGENLLLKSYIENLNTVMGYEAASIDEVTGKLKINTSEIQNNIIALKNLALADVVSNKLNAEQEKIMDSDMKLAEKRLKLKESENKLAELENVNPGTSREGNEKYGKSYLQITGEISKNKKEIAELESLIKLSEEITDKYTAYYDEKMIQVGNTSTNLPNKNSSTTTTAAESEAEILAKKAANDKAMKSEKSTLDARMDLGLYTTQIYYDKLLAIRQKYYSGKKADVTQMTDDEIQLNKEIYNQEVVFAKQRASNTETFTKEQTKAYKDMYDSQKTLAKDAYDKNKKLLKSSYDETKKKLDDDYKDEVSRIDSTLKRKEKSIDSAIKAIDKEMDARKRLKQTEEYDTQINSLKAQLSYGKMDDFTRREVAAELKRIEEEKSDYAWELKQTDRKAELSEELNDARERAERQKANLQELLEINKTAAEEGYELQIEKLDTTYQMHLTQLETMFDTSSTKMGEISNSFVSTISKGCEAAAKKLSGLISQANSAASKISTVKNYSSNDNSVRSANVNINGSNYTEAQRQRMIDKILYE